MRFGRVVTRILPTTLLTLPLISCSGSPSDSVVLTAEMPLHLEEHLEAATIVGSEVPAEVPEAVEWRFDEPQPEWKPAVPWNPTIEPVQVTYINDALRLTLTEANAFTRRDGRRYFEGDISVDVPDWQREDWVYVLVRARASEGVEELGIGFNLKEGSGTATDFSFPFSFEGEWVYVVNDGSVQTYLLRADRPRQPDWEGPWQQLGLWFGGEEPASLDLLSVSVVPKEATFADARVGVRTDVRGQAYRRTLYTHAPGRLEYRIRVPEAGRLDVGLGVLRDDAPVTFRITASAEGGAAESLLEETYADEQRWAQRSVDLSGLAGQTVTLALEADAERAGTVALWAAPTLTGAGDAERPNVIFYVIDAGGADYMSVYGYNRRTTPNLERLAAGGAVFEHAYSNSSWTKPSTASFMTSLQSSVLGGLTGRDPVPEQAVTMAQHLHRAGYQTAVFTSNPNAGTLSNLERGVDALRDGGVFEPSSASSQELHEDYWRWREAYPAEPYWVHFQTTDVASHSQTQPVAPFAGLFTGPELRESYYEWDRQLAPAGGRGRYSAAYAPFADSGISRLAFFGARRGLYDENIAHQDYQIGRLVERLKARGEWENTLLIVASDHGSHSQQGLGMLDSLPPRWGPMFRSSVTRVPLIFVWPGRIAGGQRFSQPVSMIDVLPTILDLVGLPRPEVMQGHSLAPLLLGEKGWEPRPVILDEFNVDQETGEFGGQIEVIDGRWGASLEINPDPEQEPEEQRPVPLLLYDLWNDPLCLNSLHEERPDLVEKYTGFLEAQWEAHQALATRFTPGGEVALTPEQLRTLRALGYIQ